MAGQVVAVPKEYLPEEWNLPYNTDNTGFRHNPYPPGGYRKLYTQMKREPLIGSSAPPKDFPQWAAPELLTMQRKMRYSGRIWGGEYTNQLGDN